MSPEPHRRPARRGACLAAIVSPFAAGAHAQPACPFAPDALEGVFVNASTPEQTRQMMLMGGRKHELVPVAGDADKAVVVRHRGDVPAFPQVACVRGGRDVMLQVTGLGFEPDEKARTRRIDDINAKLLKLPRLP